MYTSTSGKAIHQLVGAILHDWILSQFPTFFVTRYLLCPPGLQLKGSSYRAKGPWLRQGSFFTLNNWILSSFFFLQVKSFSSRTRSSPSPHY